MLSTISLRWCSFFCACEAYQNVRVFTQVNAVKCAVMLGCGQPKNCLIIFDDVGTLARVKRCFDQVVNVRLDWHRYPGLAVFFAHLGFWTRKHKRDEAINMTANRIVTGKQHHQR